MQGCVVTYTHKYGSQVFVAETPLGAKNLIYSTMLKWLDVQKKNPTDVKVLVDSIRDDNLDGACALWASMHDGDRFERTDFNVEAGSDSTHADDLGQHLARFNDV